MNARPELQNLDIMTSHTKLLLPTDPGPPGVHKELKKPPPCRHSSLSSTKQQHPCFSLVRTIDIMTSCINCSDLSKQLDDLRKERDECQKAYAAELRRHEITKQNEKYYTNLWLAGIDETKTLRRIIASGLVNPPENEALAKKAKQVKTEEEVKKDEERKRREKEQAVATALANHQSRIDALEKDREARKHQEKERRENETAVNAALVRYLDRIGALERGREEVAALVETKM